MVSCSMGFVSFEIRAELPDEVWAAFPQVQIYLSQNGLELKIVIVPTGERVLLPGMIQDQPEATFLHHPEVTFLHLPSDGAGLPWQP